MRIVVNTILNSLIKEFIKLIANYSKGYKKLINSSLPTCPLREEKSFSQDDVVMTKLTKALQIQIGAVERYN